MCDRCCPIPQHLGVLCGSSAEKWCRVSRAPSKHNSFYAAPCPCNTRCDPMHRYPGFINLVWVQPWHSWDVATWQVAGLGVRLGNAVKGHTWRSGHQA